MKHLILFVKAPRLGAVKTRLSANIGVLKAWRFYRASVAQTFRRLDRDPRWRCILSVTPDRFARSGDLPQGRGDLGARMGRALNSVPRGPALLIGGDIPDIETRDVARAFRELESHDMVYGPSSDGGYWLIGLKRRGRLALNDVRWSTEFALEDTNRNLEGQGIAFLTTLDDVDTGADLARI